MALTLVSLKWVGSKEFTGRPPSPRQGHAIAMIDNTAYIFGGTRCVEEPEKGIFYYRDLHKLHFGKVLRWEKVRYAGDAPIGRHDHALCVIDDTLYIFGGRNEINAEESLPGLYSFNTRTSSWKQVKTQGIEPRSLNPGWAVIDRRIFVIGGIYKGEAHCDVDVLDTDTCTWTKLTVFGIIPTPRCDHKLVSVGGNIYLFGGSGGQDKWFNDLHILDTDSLKWTSPPVRGDPPPPRGCHSLTLHADKDIYIFGGSNDSLKGNSTTLGDLHKLSLAKNKWKRPFYSGNPPSRRFGHVACTYLNCLYVFGGTNEEFDYNDVKAAQLINPSNRQPLKVSSDLLHSVLYGGAVPGSEDTTAAVPMHDNMISSATEDQDHSDEADSSSSSSSSSNSSSDTSDED